MEQVVTLQDIYNKLKALEKSVITKQELDSALESVMIASNENTMRQIQNSEEDIKKGRTKTIHSVNEI